LTEAERVQRLLAHRCAAAGVYGDVEGTDGRDTGTGFLHVTLHLLDADVMVFVEENPDGKVKEALSFMLLKTKPGASLHLNGWRRPPEDVPVPDLVDALWAKFWRDEEENSGLGRVLWMHGPTLPALAEGESHQERLPLAVPPPEIDPLDELLGSLEPPSVEPPPRKKPSLISEEDVLALFGDG
jgi:hypothetical protein